MPNMSGMTYYNINVACLNDLDIDAPVHYFDCQNDNWGAQPLRYDTSRNAAFDWQD